MTISDESSDDIRYGSFESLIERVRADFDDSVGARRIKREVWKKACPRTGNKWPCARHELCTWCHNAFARKKAFELHNRHQMATRMKHLKLAGELTKTLPGNWHKIRSAPIWDQYKYFTKRSRNKRWMRYLRDSGAVGGIEFLEITQNSTTGAWNLHSHDLLYSNIEDDVQIRPTRKVEICSACGLETDECENDSHLVQPVSTKNLGGTSYKLRDYGWGQRYSWDPGVNEEIAVGYLTKLAYAAKPIQFSTKVEDLGDLTRLFLSQRPRMTRVWGELRFSAEEREEWENTMDEEER
jgi:hypothetical protein